MTAMESVPIGLVLEEMERWRDRLAVQQRLLAIEASVHPLAVDWVNYETKEEAAAKRGEKMERLQVEIAGVTARINKLTAWRAA